MQETWVQSLGWEGPLDEEMAILSNILAQRIPWTEGPGGLQFIGSHEEWDMTERTHTHNSQLASEQTDWKLHLPLDHSDPWAVVRGLVEAEKHGFKSWLCDLGQVP